MHPTALTVRLQQLEKNILKVVQLLGEYEEELNDEDDPLKKSKYRRRIEDLKTKQIEYENELTELQRQSSNQQTPQFQNIAKQLQGIHNKIDLLLDGQSSLSQALLFHFTSVEQLIVQPFIQSLGESDLIQIQASLETIDTKQPSDDEAQIILIEVKQLLTELKSRNLSLPVSNEAMAEIINYPTIDTKHSLKLTIPIIPFILSYEGELGTEAGIKLRETWQNWKLRLFSQK
jgi:hypothetical protein